jgi:hypothetical protein
MAEIDLTNLKPADLWEVPYAELPKEALLAMVRRLREERAGYQVEYEAQRAKRREKAMKKQAKLGPVLKRRPLAALRKDRGEGAA